MSDYLNACNAPSSNIPELSQNLCLSLFKYKVWGQQLVTSRCFKFCIPQGL